MKASVRRIVNAGLLLAIVFVLYLAAAPSTSRAYWRRLTSPSLGCPAAAYAAGRWERSPGELANVTKPDDVFALSGWTGCASVQEPGWHLASTDPALYHWRTEASMARWTWRMGAGCAGFRRFDGAELVRHLVERGGWLLTGDSMTEAHFFSLSCALHPHVRAEPAANTEQHYYLRAPAQSLFLAPTSPLVRTLRFPPGFDIAQTPLVTYRRGDVIFPPDEMLPLYARVAPNKTTGPKPAFAELYGDLATPIINYPSSELLALFAAGHYSALVLSTGAHWTTSLFRALHSNEEILELFAAAARRWVRLAAPGPGRGMVLVRGATWGHEDCLFPRVRLAGAADEVSELKQEWFNWRWIPRLNDAFAQAVDELGHPRVHYLGIERPTMLRPDAHVLTDCLHFAVGTGVMETWTEYIAHFLWGEDLP